MKVLIVCNGFPPSVELLSAEAEASDFIIGADGGGNTLLKHGILPDEVIGDMDSFVKPDEPAFTITHDPDQETNDLEKALNLAVKMEAKECVVLGAFGRRMDHSLKNLSVMKQFNTNFDRLVYKDEHQRCILVNSVYRGKEPAGTVISLFPLSGSVEGITTEGLKFPLNNEALTNGKRDGTSNETVEEFFSVEVQSGDLLLFIGR